MKTLSLDFAVTSRQFRATEQGRFALSKVDEIVSQRSIINSQAGCVIEIAGDLDWEAC